MRTILVNYLQMLAAQDLRPKRWPDYSFTVKRLDPPEGEANRYFYEHIGAEWGWNERLNWSAADWHAYATSAEVSTFVGKLAGEPIGYFELRRDQAGDVEVVYFGLLPGFIGRGLGGALLTAAIEQAWALAPQRRVWLHTCTDDHPHALAHYVARGFVVYQTHTRFRD
jgi:GNAT superfamily N-acetyltransferase